MRTQCAWCLRYTGADGRRTGDPAPKDNDASHGFCDVCFEREMREVRRQFKGVVESEAKLNEPRGA